MERKSNFKQFFAENFRKNFENVQKARIFLEEYWKNLLKDI